MLIEGLVVVYSVSEQSIKLCILHVGKPWVRNKNSVPCCKSCFEVYGKQNRISIPFALRLLPTGLKFRKYTFFQTLNHPNESNDILKIIIVCGILIDQLSQTNFYLRNNI